MTQTPKPFPPAKPQIPADVLRRRRLQDDETPLMPHRHSIVFSEEFNHYRHLIAALELEPDCNIPATYLARLVASAGLEVAQSQTSMSMSWLHLAAMKGDVPLAYEMIRMGASLSVTDSLGRSPLYMGCYMLSIYARNRSISDEASLDGFTAVHMQELLSKIARVCILLVEQHSDVHETRDTITLLHLACASQSWSSYECFLLTAQTRHLLGSLIITIPSRLSKPTTKRNVTHLSSPHNSTSTSLSLLVWQELERLSCRREKQTLSERVFVHMHVAQNLRKMLQEERIDHHRRLVLLGIAHHSLDDKFYTRVLP